jgi:hypothetical protein
VTLALFFDCVDFASFPYTHNLQHLNLSHNRINIVDKPALNALSRLTTLDLSFNNLPPTLSYTQLPTRAQLRYLNLVSQTRGSPTLSPPAVVASMNTCLADGPPTLLLDSTSYFIVPRAELRNFDGTASTCDRVVFNNENSGENDGVLRFLPCPGAEALVGGNISHIRSTYLCDGIVDCPTGGDEDPSDCNFALDFVSHLTADVPECSLTTPCFLSKINVSVRHGVVVLNQPFTLLSPDCVARFSATFIGGAFVHVTPTRLEYGVSGSTIRVSFVLARLPLNGTHQQYLLNMTTQSPLSSVGIQGSCSKRVLPRLLWHQ